MTGLKLNGVGKALPENEVTNDDLSKIVDTSHEWIETRTGICKRHFASDDTVVSLGAKAAKNAIENAKINIDEIGICIVASFSNESMMPSAACMIAGEIGLAQSTICFDLNAACTGFVYALSAAHSMLAASGKKHALVIGSEVISRCVDMTDRSVCVLFGDGAGAAVISLADNQFCFEGGCIPNYDVLYCQRRQALIGMDGHEVFRFAVKTVPLCVTSILEKAKLSADDIDYIVCHQANKRIIEAAAKKLKLPIEKFFINLQSYGNTSAASIPIALCDMPKKQNAKIICVGFGAGLTYGAALLTL